jgi:hypothetical protein
LKKTLSNTLARQQFVLLSMCDALILVCIHDIAYLARRARHDDDSITNFNLAVTNEETNRL